MMTRNSHLPPGGGDILLHGIRTGPQRQPRGRPQRYSPSVRRSTTCSRAGSLRRRHPRRSGSGEGTSRFSPIRELNPKCRLSLPRSWTTLARDPRARIQTCRRSRRGIGGDRTCNADSVYPMEDAKVLQTRASIRHAGGPKNPSTHMNPRNRPERTVLDQLVANRRFMWAKTSGSALRPRLARATAGMAVADLATGAILRIDLPPHRPPKRRSRCQAEGSDMLPTRAVPLRLVPQ